jgi:hypothetical protein
MLSKPSLLLGAILRFYHSRLELPPRRHPHPNISPGGHQRNRHMPSMSPQHRLDRMEAARGYPPEYRRHDRGHDRRCQDAEPDEQRAPE